MTFYSEVRKLIELILPSSLNYDWYNAFFDITTIVVTLLVFFVSIILPFWKLINWGIFGNSKRNKLINGKVRDKNKHNL